MYQLHFDGSTDFVYRTYWDESENHFIEELKLQRSYKYIRDDNFNYRSFAHRKNCTCSKTA